MKTINITITNLNLSQNLIIDTINNKLTINNQTKDIKEDKIYELLRIIRDWSPSYLNHHIIDSEKYKIIITDSHNDETILEGVGEYPVNYSSFKTWIGDVLHD